MKKASALCYNGTVPQVKISAEGELAECMLKIAEENGIPVYRDRDLAEILSALPDGADIPEELFASVVQVFAWCWQINKEFREKADKFQVR